MSLRTVSVFLYLSSIVHNFAPLAILVLGFSSTLGFFFSGLTNIFLGRPLFALTGSAVTVMSSDTVASG
uniref:Uncharacterized protein n=1 Tax=Pararge aegeria TaxID=116150 RepID=S4NJL8_9NEOP